MRHDARRRGFSVTMPPPVRGGPPLVGTSMQRAGVAQESQPGHMGSTKRPFGGGVERGCSGEGGAASGMRSDHPASPSRQTQRTKATPLCSGDGGAGGALRDEPLSPRALLPALRSLHDGFYALGSHARASPTLNTYPPCRPCHRPGDAMQTGYSRPPVAVPDPSCAVGAIDRRLGGRVWELWASPWLAGVTVAVVRWLPPPPPPLRAGRRRRHHTDTRRMEGGTPRARPAHGQRVPPPRSPWVSLVCWRGGLAGGRQSQQTIAKNRA